MNPPRELNQFWLRRGPQSAAIPESKTIVYLPGKKEPQLQIALNAAFGIKSIAGKNVSCVYVDSSSRPYLHGRKPDGTFLAPGWNLSAAGVVFVAEYEVGGFNPGSLLHILY